MYFYLVIFNLLIFDHAHAYLGLGPLLPAITSVIGYVLLIIFSVLGFISYPIVIIYRKFFKKKNNKKKN